MFSTNVVYSENEKKLFAALGIERYTEHSIVPSIVYRAAIEEAFIQNKQGGAVEALRRGAKAFLVDGTPYRLTEAFDKLIEV